MDIKELIPVNKILTKLFLFNVMVTEESIWTFTDSKSAVSLMLNDKRQGYCLERVISTLLKSCT